MVLNWCANLEDAEMLVLQVRENTPAHKIYEHYGFQTYGVLERGIIESNGDVFNEMYMRKDL